MAGSGTGTGTGGAARSTFIGTRTSTCRLAASLLLREPRDSDMFMLIGRSSLNQAAVGTVPDHAGNIQFDYFDLIPRQRRCMPFSRQTLQFGDQIKKRFQTRFDNSQTKVNAYQKKIFQY